METTMKHLVAFEIEKDNRLYRFTMPTAAPAGEVYDVLFEFLNKVVKISQENIKSMERKDKPETSVEG